MLEVNERDIRLSYGDKLHITFQFNGYELAPDDLVSFSVKRTAIGPELLERNYKGLSGNLLKVFIQSGDMAKLPVGNSYYDIHVIRPDGNKITLMYPAKLQIIGVVHDV